MRGTTEGINLVAQTYGRKFLQPGDEIVLSTLEHHANIVPWQMVAKEKGAVLRVVPVNDRARSCSEQYEALLGPRTRIVSLSHASNSLGTILPVAEMMQMAKRCRRVLIDGRSRRPLAGQRTNARLRFLRLFRPQDLCADRHRRRLGQEEMLEVMPPWQGGGSMIRTSRSRRRPTPIRPRSSKRARPTSPARSALARALDYVNRWAGKIGRHEQELLEYATRSSRRSKDLRIIGTAGKVAVIRSSFKTAARKTSAACSRLRSASPCAGHHCAQPSLRRFGLESTVRPSFSIYNTKDEIDRLVDAVRKIQVS